MSENCRQTQTHAKNYSYRRRVEVAVQVRWCNSVAVLHPKLHSAVLRLTVVARS
jgi:hypothetical protein